MLSEKLDRLHFRLRNVFSKKYQVIRLARNDDDQDYVIAKFNREFHANRYVDLLKASEKDLKIQNYYMVKLGKKVILYK